MRDKISPEEKLLRLIRGQNKEYLSEKSKNDNLNFALNRPSLPSFISFKKSAVRILVLLLFIGLCVYLIYVFLFPWYGFKEVKLSPQSIETNLEVKGIVPEMKPYEFYLSGIRDHQLFNAPVKSLNSDIRIGMVNTDILKDITLVGIIAGERPQAVIEDNKTHKIFYLTKGQFLGDIQVEDIQEGKIILNYQGQKFELYL